MTVASLRRLARRGVLASTLLVSAALPVAGDQSLPTTLDERARGADRVLVATVVDARAAYQVNAHGDRLIVTRARLAVESHWKGAPAALVDVEIEGGTVDGVTLGVSDLPSLERGERAIFFLHRRPDGSFVPHLRGHGVLKLDRLNRIRGTGLNLDDARRITLLAR